MWQFMPATGKDFELRQNLFRDDRRDVLASTRAALDYLERLHARFGDWQLALAAYNWGQGNVQRAVDRNLNAGLPADYESLQRLPLETREYVPKLQAVKNIVLRPEAFGLELPSIENHPYFLTVAIERDIDLKTAARLAGLDLDEFRQLNPQHHKPVILAAGTPQVLLPYDNANRFLRELAMHQGALATWTAWVAPRTLKPADAARTLGMDEAHLREVNRIPPRMMVKAGSTLLVPRGVRVDADVPEQVADGATIAFAPEAPPLRKVAFKAKKGETVATIARRYRLSPALVAQWNGVGAAARFTRGQSVVVMLPPRRAAPPTRGTSTRVAAASSKAAPSKAARRAPAGKAPARVQVAQR
jgi:membrane-bound lytic murein transglycosylase D